MIGLVPLFEVLEKRKEREVNRRRVCGVCKCVKPSDSTVNECVKLMKLQSTIGSPSILQYFDEFLRAIERFQP